VGGGESLGKKRVGRLLTLGVVGVQGGLFSHPSASVSVRRGVRFVGEESSMEQP
jgi:hypothetical protein